MVIDALDVYMCHFSAIGDRIKEFRISRDLIQFFLTFFDPIVHAHIIEHSI